MEDTRVCSHCGGTAVLEYENRAISWDEGGIFRLVGTPYYYCKACHGRSNDEEVEQLIEAFLENEPLYEEHKVFLWSGQRFVEVDPNKTVIPDYPDRYIKNAKKAKSGTNKY